MITDIIIAPHIAFGPDSPLSNSDFVAALKFSGGPWAMNKTVSPSLVLTCSVKIQLTNRALLSSLIRSTHCSTIIYELSVLHSTLAHPLVTNVPKIIKKKLK